MADTASTPQPTAAPSGGESRPTAPEVSSWRGFHLDESSGATAGRIEGWYADDTGGRPEWLIVRLGRFGRNSLVPARDAVGASGRVWVPYDRATIRAAPRVESYQPLDLETERALLAHYGLAGGERGAELDERPAGQVSARPGS